MYHITANQAILLISNYKPDEALSACSQGYPLFAMIDDKMCRRMDASSSPDAGGRTADNAFQVDALAREKG